MKYKKYAYNFIILLFILLTVFPLNINAKEISCSEYHNFYMTYFDDYVKIAYPYIESLDYNESEIILIEDIDYVLKRTDEVIRYKNEFLEEKKEKYSNCTIDNKVELYYDSLIRVYTNLCQELNRGITINKIVLDDEKPMEGYCNIEGKNNININEDAKRNLNYFKTEYEGNFEDIKFEKSLVQIENNDKSPYDSKFEAFVMNNFGSIMEKLPFEDQKNNFYLFVGIICIILYYVFIKRK